ncbi:hypothetical protein [Natrarchaeobius chitinivorans]|uniref:SWIM-type domain-containing protein n=1 Tax=Natrarchaeobius chitinivorans TaxID=1679083 RepID=A0A3N6NY39_NATCH|nr:hypothetical protein [Natrarchaeobius chitinivorans]RQG89709.1 hypothetical protein EA473_21555 [Natrarchaeobius chitinivorans]
MTTYVSDHKVASDWGIDARDVRALTEHMTVCEHVGPARDTADRYLVVSESGSEYVVDICDERCDCPDATYNLPTEDGRKTCKHVAAAAFCTGKRQIPVPVDREKINPQLLTAEHVNGSPRFVEAVVGDENLDPSAGGDRHAITDGGRNRPADCCCPGALPCCSCWDVGFRKPNPDTEVTEE